MAAWTIVGQLSDASNTTLLVEEDSRRYVYKPVRGERRLWDFPDGTLGRREVAAYEMSQRLGWDVVPRTRWVADAPLGPGSVQDWVDHRNDLVGVFRAGAEPSGWLPVISATGVDDEPLVVAHADTASLRRLALFDLVVNNTDRKGGHVLGPGGADVAGIDNGLCFHAEPKVRTVLWGFAGDPIPELLLRDLAAAQPDLTGFAGLSGAECDALQHRIGELLQHRAYPAPGPGPVIPWPPI